MNSGKLSATATKKSAIIEATSTCKKANEIVFILKWDKNTKALNELIKIYEDGIKAKRETQCRIVFDNSRNLLSLLGRINELTKNLRSNLKLKKIIPNEEKMDHNFRLFNLCNSKAKNYI